MFRHFFALAGNARAVKTSLLSCFVSCLFLSGMAVAQDYDLVVRHGRVAMGQNPAFPPTWRSRMSVSLPSGVCAAKPKSHRRGAVVAAGFVMFTRTGRTSRRCRWPRTSRGWGDHHRQQRCDAQAERRAFQAGADRHIDQRGDAHRSRHRARKAMGSSFMRPPWTELEQIRALVGRP